MIDLRTVVLLLLVAQGVWSEAQAVDWDALPPEEVSQQIPVGLQMNLYVDFDLDWTVPNDQTVVPTSVLTQNHREILVRAAPGSPLDLEGDLLAPASFFTVGFPLALAFPALAQTFLGTSVLKTGVLLIPFGEFNFHHLYGGREDNSGTFLDRLWGDLGIDWSGSPWAGSLVDFYITNGMAESSSGPSWRPQQAGSDKNSAKAWGARWRQDIAPGWFTSLSFYRDAYGKDSEPEKQATMGGLDAGLRWTALTLKSAGAWAWVEGAGQSFLRSGWYTEAQWSFSPVWAIRLRGGTMDTDSRILNPGDRADINAALIWKTGPVEWNLDAFLDGPLTDSQGLLGKTATWEFLIKLLYTI